MERRRIPRNNAGPHFPCRTASRVQNGACRRSSQRSLTRCSKRAARDSQGAAPFSHCADHRALRGHARGIETQPTFQPGMERAIGTATDVSRTITRLRASGRGRPAERDHCKRPAAGKAACYYSAITAKLRSRACYRFLFGIAAARRR